MAENKRIKFEGEKIPAEGLEPTHLAALDPKSSVSTNSTTQALKSPIINVVSESVNYKCKLLQHIFLVVKATELRPYC